MPDRLGRVRSASPRILPVGSALARAGRSTPLGKPGPSGPVCRNLMKIAAVEIQRCASSEGPDMESVIDLVFGEGPDLEAWQMAARGVCMFVIALVMVRISGRRS